MFEKLPDREAFSGCIEIFATVVRAEKGNLAIRRRKLKSPVFPRILEMNSTGPPDGRMTEGRGE